MNSTSSTIGKAALIKGEFTKAEAREVLSNLFMSKIAFHKDKNFSNEIRFNQPDKHALKRASELLADMENCLEAIQRLPDNSPVRIHCNVELEAIAQSSDGQMMASSQSTAFLVNVLE